MQSGKCREFLLCADLLDSVNENCFRSVRIGIDKSIVVHGQLVRPNCRHTQIFEIKSATDHAVAPSMRVKSLHEVPSIHEPRIVRNYLLVLAAIEIVAFLAPAFLSLKHLQVVVNGDLDLRVR